VCLILWIICFRGVLVMCGKTGVQMAEAIVSTLNRRICPECIPKVGTNIKKIRRLRSSQRAVVVVQSILFSCS
jgi:hypothetical protein